MENINESFTKYTRSNLDAMLKKDYATAVKNPEFKKRIFHSICDGHFPEWVPVNEKNHNPNTNNGIISKE